MAERCTAKKNPFPKGNFLYYQVTNYSSTCHERPLPVRSESVPSWQVAPRGRDRKSMIPNQKHTYILHIILQPKHSNKTFNYNILMLTYTLKRPCIEFGVVRIDSAIVVCIHSAIIQLLLTRQVSYCYLAG